MMIAETKPPHPRRLEGRALLVGSTQSCHFAIIRFATSRNAAFNRSVDLSDRPIGGPITHRSAHPFWQSMCHHPYQRQEKAR